jgi:hypothetical protein
VTRKCNDCGRVYDDVGRWTICPHPPLTEIPPTRDDFIREMRRSKPLWRGILDGVVEFVAAHPVMFVVLVIGWFVFMAWIKLAIIRWFVR